jgi:hypothetical protein
VCVCVDCCCGSTRFVSLSVCCTVSVPSLLWDSVAEGLSFPWYFKSDERAKREREFRQRWWFILTVDVLLIIITD